MSNNNKIEKIGNKIEYHFYNENQKNEYIKVVLERETKLPQNFLERMFTYASRFEEELGKDVSEFTTPNIKYMYKILNLPSIESVQNYNSQLRRYTAWCLSHGRNMDCANHYEEIKDFEEYVDLKTAKRKMITREDLISKSSRLSNPCDRFALLAIFEGINGKERVELMRLRTTDFNDDGTVSIEREVEEVGKKVERRIVFIKVSDMLRDLAFESAKMENYEVASGRRFVLQEDPTLVIKNFMACKEESSNKYKGRRLYFRLTRCLATIDCEEYSINSISDSGKIHLINQIAERENISGKKVLDTPALRKEVEDQFGTKINRTIFFRKYEEYLRT